MSNILRDVRVKARKEHRCFLCGGKIAKGQMCRCYSFLFDGDIHRNYEHSECAELVDELDEMGLMDGGEYMPDDFEDALNDLCREKVCPTCETYDAETGECAEDKCPICDCVERVWEYARTHTYTQKDGWVRKQTTPGGTAV